MPSYGKTIRIYLPDGTPTGIRHAELVNWTGQAVACPRGRYAEIAKWPEGQRPGVYILFGRDGDGDLAYVGEAENVVERLKHHVGGKDFWTQVVFFTAKDENLTKSHVKYLESRIVSTALELKRMRIENGNSPGEPSLPRADRDAMNEFLESLSFVLGTLGFPLLQPLTHAVVGDDNARPGPLSSVELRFENSKRGVVATGASTDEGFVVRSGSLGTNEVRDHMGKGYAAIRTALIADGTIVVDGDRLRFTRDWLFDSPSAAACVLAGGTYNGREAWRDVNGRTLKQLEEMVAGVSTQ
jgi:hypothetical protein